MPRRRLPLAVLALLVLCAAFGWWQNTHGTTGGAISPPKVLWLFLALTCFFLLPAARVLDAAAPAAERRFWRIFLACWLVRGVVEIPMLLATRWWRCEYGIAHTLAMLALLLRACRPAAPQRPDVSLLHVLTGIALAFEALNAWLFSLAGRPEAGQYFASTAPAFQWINRITWAEVGVLAPLLLLWLRRAPRPA